MTGDEYVLNVVNNYKLPETIDWYTEDYVVKPLKSHITAWAYWANLPLLDIKLSGSRAKGTAIKLSSDLDLFISISSSTNLSLKDIYGSLYHYLTSINLLARKQNVSIGVKFNGLKIDLVPAKRQNPFGNDHSLYRSKADTWTKTNIDTHISAVRKSRRQTEIIALKIWRELHHVNFPSIYLETFAIDALKNRDHLKYADNFIYLLKSVRDNILVKRILDPANANNCLSDELTFTEKKTLVNKANESLRQSNWSNIIW